MEMTIHLNGQPVQTAANVSLSSLLREKGIEPSHVVVEINRQIIDREAFDTTVINPDATIEILRFVGGG